MLLNRLLKRLRVSEGWRSRVYLDTTGHLTIGYGHNLGKITVDTNGKLQLNPIGELPRNLGEAWLVADVMATIEQLRGHLPWLNQLDDVRASVLIDMAFNMGVMGTPTGKKGLVDGWPNFLESVRTGRYAEATSVMRTSRWSKQVGARALRLAKMMETGAED